LTQRTARVGKSFNVNTIGTADSQILIDKRTTKSLHIRF